MSLQSRQRDIRGGDGGPTVSRDLGGASVALWEQVDDSLVQPALHIGLCELLVDPVILQLEQSVTLSARLCNKAWWT